VTGVAALLRAYNPNLLGEDMEQIMTRTARDMETPPATPGFDVRTGHGMVQASAALDYVTPPRYVRQRSVGFEGTSGTLTFRDSVELRDFVLENDPDGVSNLPRSATRVRLKGKGGLGGGFQVAPTVWVRSSGTLGWDSLLTFDFQQDVRWGRITAGSVMPDSAEFETFVYRIGGTPKLWYPCRPDSARVAFTAVGSVDTLAVGVASSEPVFALRLSPNPFSEKVNISFGISQRGNARLDIVDVVGRVVATVLHRELESGTHAVQWDGRSRAGERCAAGVYICRLRITGQQEVRKFAIVGRSAR
jgi:hypothetical protein